MTEYNRREFIRNMATAVGGLVLVPAVTRVAIAQDSQPTSQPTSLPTGADAYPVPMTRPDDWDPIVFNRDRGNAGAIPESYRDAINGPEGVTSHLGKHLPYVPELPNVELPEGYVAVMWGDPEKGYTRHPNAVPNESNNNEGHWYNWIRVRKAVEGETEELQSTFTGWPELGEGDTGSYAVFGAGDISEDSGKNTIYLTALPAGLVAGDTVRIYAHCLTHGEYVDFLTI